MAYEVNNVIILYGFCLSSFTIKFQLTGNDLIGNNYHWLKFEVHASVITRSYKRLLHNENNLAPEG